LVIGYSFMVGAALPRLSGFWLNTTANCLSHHEDHEGLEGAASRLTATTNSDSHTEARGSQRTALAKAFNGTSLGLAFNKKLVFAVIRLMGASLAINCERDATT
jgi:hypothetical protein